MHDGYIACGADEKQIVRNAQRFAEKERDEKKEAARNLDKQFDLWLDRSAVAFIIHAKAEEWEIHQDKTILRHGKGIKDKRASVYRKNQKSGACRAPADGSVQDWKHEIQEKNAAKKPFAHPIEIGKAIEQISVHAQNGED